MPLTKNFNQYQWWLTWIYIYMYIYIYIYIYIKCTYGCTCTHIYIHTHIYIYKHDYFQMLCIKSSSEKNSLYLNSLKKVIKEKGYCWKNRVLWNAIFLQETEPNEYKLAFHPIVTNYDWFSKVLSSTRLALINLLTIQ
jgi:hypothetical protein